MPRSAVTRARRTTPLAWLGGKHRPAPSCASLAAAPHRVAHRRGRIDRAPPSSPVCDLGVTPQLDAARVGIARTGR